MPRKLHKRLKAGHWYGIQSIEKFSLDGNLKYSQKWHRLVDENGAMLGSTATPAMVRRALEELSLKLASESREGTLQDTRLSVMQLASRFIDSKTSTVRPTTLQSYKLWTMRFVDGFGRLQVSEVTPHVGERFKSLLLARHSMTTVNIALRVMRTMFSWAMKNGYVEKNPMEYIDFVRVPVKTVAPHITWNDFQSIVLPTVSDQRHRVAFCLGIYAGLRRAEMCNLAWTHIDFTNDVIHVLSTETFQTKSGKGRQIPLYAPLKRELAVLSHVSSYVLGVSSAVPDGSAVSHAWLDTVRAVNSTLPLSDKLPHLRLHDLRASFCTELLQRLAPAVAQQILGHADVQTTLKYYSHISVTMAVKIAKEIEF